MFFNFSNERIEKIIKIEKKNRLRNERFDRIEEN